MNTPFRDELDRAVAGRIAILCEAMSHLLYEIDLLGDLDADAPTDPLSGETEIRRALRSSGREVYEMYAGERVDLSHVSALVRDAECLTAVILNRAGIPWSEFGPDRVRQAAHRRFAQRGNKLYEQAQTRGNGPDYGIAHLAWLIEQAQEMHGRLLGEDGDTGARLERVRGTKEWWWGRYFRRP